MEFTSLILTIFAILVTAKLFGELFQRMGQSPVLGELVGGMIIGASVLGLVKESQTLHDLAQIGAILLLFEVGVCSNLYEFVKIGIWSLLVAVVGVICPFFFGYLVCLYFGLDSVHSIFVGAILTATSVGITARVFADLKKLNTKEAQIILGAAVIDDVIGLGILAVVLRLVTSGTVSPYTVLNITGLAIAFVAGALIIGALCAPYLFKFIKRMKIDGAVIVGAFAFCLLLSYLSAAVGLAPIVGAFAAGLILSITESKNHIEEKIKPVSHIFVPIFFVLMGALVDVKIFNPFDASNTLILKIAAALFVVAVISKMLSGTVVFKKGINRLIIGIGMIPRGEVGLIFAGMGLTNNIINSSIYSASVAVIIMTTFVTPFLLKLVMKDN